MHGNFAMTIFTRSLLLACTIGLSACGSENNPLFGRAATDIGPYHVVVVDCYVWRKVPVESIDDGAGKRFAPCKDSVVTIEAGNLYVNGEPSGQLIDGDRVVVEHGKVRIDHE